MYKILIIDESIQNIQLNGKVKYVTTNKAFSELKSSEYDLIYINLNYQTKILEETIFSDYMELPKKLKKLTVQNDIKNTYINLQIINKLIFDNLEIIEFKNFNEEMTIALILKQFLIGETKVKKIYNNICPKDLNIKEVRKTVDNVVKKNYTAENILRKFKYYICHKTIKKKFFENILINIENDIDKMEQL